jgi:hypothetical protein
MIKLVFHFKNSDSEWNFFILGKNMVIDLGVKYEQRKVAVTIIDQFTKFKNQVRKELKESGVNDMDILEIIITLQKNYMEIYPDGNSISEVDKSTNEKTIVPKVDIPFGEWQSQLIILFNRLKTIVESNFPGIWPAFEFTLSIKKILNIANITLPFAGIILGPPSSAKTLVLEMLRDLPNTFYTDSFTPKAFVSHNSGVSEEQLQQIDMLPKIKNKLFMTPELGPVFSSKEEELTQTLGMLTRVLDGGGFVSDTGATGHRGYSEEIMFSWVGAAVDIPHKVYKLLSTLGPKLNFFRINPGKVSVATSLEELKKNNFIERKNEVKAVLLEYIQWFEQCPIGKSIIENELMKIEWESCKDEDNALEIIIKLAHLLASLRGYAVTWETKDTQGSGYAYATPSIEHPTRAITSLANLAKGHALLEGRTHIDMRDIPIIIKTVLSTAPVERVMIFDLLLNSNGELTASDIENFLNISKPTALRTMTELKILGLVNLTQESESSNSLKTIKLKKEFEWFLSGEFKRLRQGFVPEEGKPDEKNQLKNKDQVTDIDIENKESIKKNYPHVEQDNTLQHTDGDLDTEDLSTVDTRTQDSNQEIKGDEKK